MTSRSFRFAQQSIRLVGEAAWIFGWSAVLGHWLDPTAGAALPVAALAAYLLASAALGWAVARRGDRRPHASSLRMGIAVSTLGLLASSAGGVLLGGSTDPEVLLQTVAGSRALVAGSLALLAWWRGSRMGVNRPSVYEVEGQFRFGVIALAFLLALIAILGQGAAPEPTTLVQPALVLVASGLVGVPLARIAEVSAGPRAEVPRLAPTGPWIATLLGVVAGLLLLTLLLAGALTVERVGALIGLLLGALSRVLLVLVTIVAIPAGYLVEWLTNLLRGAITGEPRQMPIQQMPPLEELLRDPDAQARLAPELELLLDVMLVLGLAAVIVMLLSRSLARRQQWAREPDGVEELRESVFGWEVLREMVSWVLERLFHRRRPAASTTPSSAADPVEARSIRAVYRDFLRLTVRLGFPRGQAETPLEYARRLERDRLGLSETGEAVPAGQTELDTLTSSYVRARYGPPAAPADPSPSARALERLRALWTRRG